MAGWSVPLLLGRQICLQFTHVCTHRDGHSEEESSSRPAEAANFSGICGHSEPDPMLNSSPSHPGKVPVGASQAKYRVRTAGPTQWYSQDRSARANCPATIQESIVTAARPPKCRNGDVPCIGKDSGRSWGSHLCPNQVTSIPTVHPSPQAGNLISIHELRMPEIQ